MNESAKQHRKQAIEAEENCRNELLEEFFNLKRKVIERLEHLCKAGMDEDAWLRLEGTKVKEESEEYYYETVNKFQVLKLKKDLKQLKEGEQPENIVSNFLSIKHGSWKYNIKELVEMTELACDITASNDALKHLQMN